MNKEVQRFCEEYQAIVGPSHRMHRRSKRIDYKLWSESDPNIFQTIPYEDIKCVEIHMPEDRFRALLEHDKWLKNAGLHDNKFFNNNVSRVSQMIVDHERESKIRNQYPSVQTAWEKYQLMLKLCDENSC